MTKIDINTWRRFHLYDDNLFDIDMGPKLDRIKMTESSPSVNFVGRANTNNGITCYVDEIKGIRPYTAGCLSLALGGEYLGSCFVQPKQFYTSQNVVVLIPKWDMSDAIKWFIATAIFRESRSYYRAFIDELNRHIKTDFSFMLPVDGKGCPDWAYMDSFMQRIQTYTESTIEKFELAERQKSVIGIECWKEFKVSDVFVTDKHGRGIQVPTGAMMAKNDLEEGDTPRVTVSNYNNGITGYYADSEDKNYRTYENFISVSFLGTVFYQPDKVSLDMKVHCLKPLDYTLNKYSAGFVVSIIRNAISNFIYADQLSSTVLADLTVTLPSTVDGFPDWEYMESFMKDVFDKASITVDELEKVVGVEASE